MRKLVCLLLATLLLVGLCFALASCGECKHGEYAEEYEIVDPTCTEDGKYVYTCLKCNEKVEVAPTADDVVMLKTGHTADKGEVTTEPTCTEKGAKTFKCKTCAAAMPEKTEEVAELGHDVDEDEYEFAAGLHWNVCTRTGCGAKINETACELEFSSFDEEHCAEVCFDCEYVDEESLVEHVYDEGEVTRAATCAAAGVMEYICENCGYAKEETIPALAHTYDETEYVSDGVHHWHECSACHDVREGSLADCVFGTPVENQPEAGSCRPGTKVSTCEACGNDKVEAIPSTTAHRLANATYDGVEGCTKYTCTECAAVYTVKGVGTLYDFESTSTTDLTGTKKPEWSTEVVEGEDGNSYVSTTVVEKLEAYEAHYFQGPFRSLDNYKYFILDFDVMADPEKGMCGTTNLACKAPTGWFQSNYLLEINRDGSITGGSTEAGELAAAGTVNGTTWTHVTITYNVETGDVSYYINGVLVSTKTGTCFKDKALTYINIIIPMAQTEDDIGCGIYLDNMSLATGENCGIALEASADAAE